MKKILLLTVLLLLVSCAPQVPQIQTSPPQQPQQQEQPEAVIPDTCGDSKCEPSEMCDQVTLKTVCPKDCNYLCQEHITSSEVTCEGLCKKEDNGYYINGNARFKINLENIGESSAYQIRSNFICRGITKTAQRDGDNFFGMEFEDYFIDFKNRKTEILDIAKNPPVNKGLYVLSLTKKSDLETGKITCTIKIKSQNTFNFEKEIKIRL